MPVVLKYHGCIILSVVYLWQAFLECCILGVFENSFYRISNSSRAASKPDFQHRTERQGTSILFSVVETKSAIAVFLGVLIQSAKPTSAFLCAVGQFFHDRLHTVEGGGIGKVHFVSSFSWNEKSPKSFAKLRAVKRKNGRQVSSDLSAVWSSYSVVREFKSIRKAKQPFYIYEYTSWNPGIWVAKNPIKSGFFMGYIFSLFWWSIGGSNPWPLDCQSNALPAALMPRTIYLLGYYSISLITAQELFKLILL